MTGLDNEIGDILVDLRRAAVAGASGDAPDRGEGVLIEGSAPSGIDRFIPSTAPLAVAIDGGGLFVLQGGARYVYSRLGDFRIDDAGRLIDGAGRTVEGFRLSGDARRAEPQPIAVAAQDIQSKRFASYRIDKDGVLLGIEHRVERRWGRRHEVSVPIAQLALALFPAPERLARLGAAAFAATPAAGPPVFAVPGEAGRGSLREHVVAAGAVDIEGDLRKLWMLRRRGEITAALASASDACVRTALGLVR